MKKMKKLLALILAAIMLLSLVACDIEVDNGDWGGDKTRGTNKNTSGIDGNYADNSQTNSPTDSSDKTEPIRFKHSDTFYNAKKRWSDIWEAGRPTDRVRDFITQEAPFNFLAEQGVVYYNDNGQPRLYVDDDCNNDLCLQTQAFIDTNSDENDFYLLVQYIDDGDVEFRKSAELGTILSTWMLKYTLSDQCYQDLLLLDADFRQNLLIQQIDKEYEPEVVSHTVAEYNFLGPFGFYYGIKDAVSSQHCIYSLTEATNYIEDIDFENMEMTVNYNLKEHPGQIYSYTFKVTESSQWLNKLTEEQRNTATWDQVMRIKETSVGKSLDDIRYAGIGIGPDAEQKASATLKYDFEVLKEGYSSKSTQFNKYELGQISFEQVNNLTRQYAKDNGLIK